MKRLAKMDVPRDKTRSKAPKPMELARVYIPNQIFTQTFPLPEGFKKGTIFPELYKPYKSNSK